MLRYRLLAAGMPLVFALAANAQIRPAIQPGTAPVNPAPPTSPRPAPPPISPASPTNPQPTTANPAPTPNPRPSLAGPLRMTPAPMSFGTPTTSLRLTQPMSRPIGNSFPFQQYSLSNSIRFGQPGAFANPFATGNANVAPFTSTATPEGNVTQRGPFIFPTATDLNNAQMPTAAPGTIFPQSNVMQPRTFATVPATGFENGSQPVLTTTPVFTNWATSVGYTPSSNFASPLAQQLFLPNVQQQGLPFFLGTPNDNVAPLTTGGTVTTTGIVPSTQFPSQSAGGIGMIPRQ